MYFSHKYLDPKAKASAVRDNTRSLILMAFAGWVNDATAEETSTTTHIVDEWVRDHPNATVTELSDFMSSLVSDFKENQSDLADDENWEE